MSSAGTGVPLITSHCCPRKATLAVALASTSTLQLLGIVHVVVRGPIKVPASPVKLIVARSAQLPMLCSGERPGFPRTAEG